MGSWISQRQNQQNNTDEESDNENYVVICKKLQQMQLTQNPGTKEKCYDPSDPNLTFADSDRDEHDFLCEGYSSRKALMSCGHSVTPTSLTSWCLKQLDEGNTEFECGVCDAVWPFDEVCKMALLTDEEKDIFGDALFRNVASKKLKTKKCPGCKSRVVRANPDDLCVRCPQCTADKGKAYDFCWQCRKIWRGRNEMSDCGNKGCESAVVILRKCAVIKFKDVKGVKGCPSIRACPTCGKLLAHSSEYCKNVTCPDCKVKFCFVCLKLSKECSDKTNSLYTSCSGGVAPRQTSIPVQRK